MAVTNPALLRYDGRTGVSLRTGQRVPWATDDSWQAAEADRMERQRRSMASHNRLVNFGRLASVAPLGLALAPGGAASMAGAAGGASGSGYVGQAISDVASRVVPHVGTAGRFTLPNLLRMAEIGVPAVTSLFGMRSQNRAMDRQSALEQQNLNAQMQFAREQEVQRRSEYDRQMQEEQRRWDTEQVNRARELAALEEERAFQRRLIEEREARRQQARMRLSQFLGMGR